MDTAGLRDAVEHGVRTAVRNNVSAYGFSVMITASFGVLAAIAGPPSAGEAYLFVAGAVSGVTIVEGIASRGFRVRIRGEPSEVVALGAAFGFISAGLGVGAAALSGELVAGWPVWLLGPLVASSVYVLGSGFEMALAHIAQERRDTSDED